MLCRHCQKTKSNRPRGLCWTCYYTPGVREKFPSTSKFARRGLGNFNGLVPLPDAPTDAAPGSEAKVLILIERAFRRQALFHPLDAFGPPDPLAARAEAQSAAEDEVLELRDAG